MLRELGLDIVSLELSASIMAVLGDRIQGTKNTVDMHTRWVMQHSHLLLLLIHNVKGTQSRYSV